MTFQPYLPPPLGCLHLPPLLCALQCDRKTAGSSNKTLHINRQYHSAEILPHLKTSHTTEIV